MLTINTPISMIAAFLGFMDTVLTAGVVVTSGSIQVSLLIFMILFTAGVTIAFFYTLWSHPGKLYSPSEYGSPGEFIEAVKIVNVKADEVVKIAKRVEDLKADLDNQIIEAKHHATAMALVL